MERCGSGGKRWGHSATYNYHDSRCFYVFTSNAPPFDPEQAYVRAWIPELDTPDYPRPVVEHAAARERALAVYREALADRD